MTLIALCVRVASWATQVTHPRSFPRSSQVEGWEENPLDVAIRRIRGMPKARELLRDIRLQCMMLCPSLTLCCA